MPPVTPASISAADSDTTLLARLHALEQAHQQLLLTNEGLQSFTASATHDLRAPLHCLQQCNGRLRAELQAHPAVLSACERWLQRQQATIDNMQQVIDGMLDLARISHAQPATDRVDCNQLTAAIVEQLRLQFPTHPVSIHIDCGEPLQADRRLIHSLLYNLLANAWKYTRHTQSPQIRVQRCMQSEVPAFQVIDNGAGFDMRYAHRLFEPFQRLHASSEFPGAGIGLATAARIVERYGGRIWARAEINAGATFEFTLPAAQGPSHPPEATDCTDVCA